jgi:endoglucanase Acf2
MKNRIFGILIFLVSLQMLASCSSGSNDQTQDNSGPKASRLLPPTPSLAGNVELGEPTSLVQRRMAAASVISVSDASRPPRLPAQAATAAYSDSKLGPISTADPSAVLGADRVVANPWQAKNLNDLKLVALPPGTRGRMPTGKWSKAFFYQNPRNIDAYFQGNGVPDDPRNLGGDPNESNIFAYPNKLNLDDRIGMLSISFPTRRYIDYSLNPAAAAYDLSNPFKTDTLLYPIAPNGSQDIRLSYVQPAEGRLPRQIDSFDELTVASSWSTPAGDKRMQVIAAEGSPYATVRYTGLRPVIQVGQGSRARTAKDQFGLPVPPVDYTQQESDNSIQAVAVGEDPATRFIENNNIRVTPSLTGTKFRFIYQIPDRAQTRPGTNNNEAVNPVQTLKELVLYASRPITLEWDTPSRSYVARDTLPVVLRTAFVDDVLYDPSTTDPTKTSDIPSFKARRAILDRYAATFPVSSKLFLDYDEQATALVRYTWDMERMDGQAAQGSDLLMMGFDATHIPSLQNANKVDGLTYRSNFGTMSAVAGSEWTQKLTIPPILRNGATAKDFWKGTGDISDGAAKTRIVASLAADTKLLTENFIKDCNTDSYICGKYLHNIARLALIADSVGEYENRDALVRYLKNSLALWLDGIDAQGKRIKPLEDQDNDSFLYDRTNGGTITSKGLQDHNKDYSNRAYVDHMFHYGYYVYAASVTAQLDTEGGWLDANREKVNLLVRDIANPSLEDAFFPIIRTFDWFRMQNIADAGPDANGGNTESSSESINSNYALVTWGVVTGNTPFQALAAIMTAAEIRTAQAFYQITPDTAYLKGLDYPEVSVTVTQPNGSSEVRKIRPGDEPVMNIVRSNLMETNTFFGGLLVNRIGINLLPITPISEFVISAAWARTHAGILRKLEDTNTAQFNDIINTPPGENSLCFKADWSPPGPHVDEKTGKLIDPPFPGASCAGRLRILYSWRQMTVAALGMTDAAGAFQRYAGYMDALGGQQALYKLNTRSDVYPGSSNAKEGIEADVLKDNSTPTTDTNTLWWLATRKPG